MPRTRNPPEDFSESKFEKSTIGTGLYNEPLIVLYWNPRPNEKRWAAMGQKAYDEAVAPARKALNEAKAAARMAYDEAVATAGKALNEAKDAARTVYDEAMAAAWTAHIEAVQDAKWKKMQRAFEPPSTRYIVYRNDEDTWEETDDADEARNLVRVAFADLKEERTRLKGAIQRTKEWAAKGVKVARFDPGKVFVRRHVRSLMTFKRNRL